MQIRATGLMGLVHPHQFGCDYKTIVTLPKGAIDAVHRNCRAKKFFLKGKSEAFGIELAAAGSKLLFCSKKMRKIAAITLMAISVILEAGCANSLSTDKASGLYEFGSGQQDTETVCFVLSPDGTYALGNADAPVEWMSYSGTPSKGQWRLMDLGQDQQLLIGNSKFPIKQTSSGVRVVIDADRGMFCDFTKPE